MCLTIRIWLLNWRYGFRSRQRSPTNRTWLLNWRCSFRSRQRSATIRTWLLNWRCGFWPRHMSLTITTWLLNWRCGFRPHQRSSTIRASWRYRKNGNGRSDTVLWDEYIQLHFKTLKLNTVKVKWNDLRVWSALPWSWISGLSIKPSRTRVKLRGTACALLTWKLHRVGRFSCCCGKIVN